jgi:hypothetical protein
MHRVVLADRGGDVEVFSRSIASKQIALQRYSSLPDVYGGWPACSELPQGATSFGHVMAGFGTSRVATVAGVTAWLWAGSQIRGDLSHDDTPTREYRISVKAVPYLRRRLSRRVVI